MAVVGIDDDIASLLFNASFTKESPIADNPEEEPTENEKSLQQRIKLEFDPTLSAPLQVLSIAASQGFAVSVETKSGYVYEGKVTGIDSFMNIELGDGDIVISRKRILKYDVDFRTGKLRSIPVIRQGGHRLLIRASDIVMVELPNELKRVFVKASKEMKKVINKKKLEQKKKKLEKLSKGVGAKKAAVPDAAGKKDFRHRRDGNDRRGDRGGRGGGGVGRGRGSGIKGAASQLRSTAPK